MSLGRWLAVAALASFSSATAAQSDYTLLIFSDSGTGEEDQKLVAAAMAQACTTSSCDAALVLGDLI